MYATTVMIVGKELQTHADAREEGEDAREEEEEEEDKEDKEEEEGEEEEAEAGMNERESGASHQRQDDDEPVHAGLRFRFNADERKKTKHTNSAKDKCSEKDICAICREKGDTRTSGLRNVMVTLPCGHRFHDFCLEKQVVVGQHTGSDAEKCAICRAKCKDFFDKLYPLCAMIDTENSYYSFRNLIETYALRLVVLDHFVFSLKPQWGRMFKTFAYMNVELQCLSPGLKMVDSSGACRKMTHDLDPKRGDVDEEYTYNDVAVTFRTWRDVDEDDYDDDDDDFMESSHRLTPIIFRFSGSWRDFKVQVVNFDAGPWLDKRGLVREYREDSEMTYIKFMQPKAFSDKDRGISG